MSRGGLFMRCRMKGRAYGSGGEAPGAASGPRRAGGSAAKCHGAVDDSLLAGGHTLAWPCPRTTSYAEATDEGPHPLAWLMAARLLGLPFPGEEGAGG